jgi:hypothetical protein
MTTLAELIAANCSDLGDNYPAIAERLNTPIEIDNPSAGQTTTTTVYPTVTLVDVLGKVPSAERVSIRQLLPGFSEDVKGGIDSGNHLYMAGLIEDALTAGAISAQTAGKLAELLAPKEVTTTQPATIAGPSLAAAAGFGTVTAADVQAELNHA